MQKRVVLSQTGSHTPSIGSIDFQGIAEKCMALGREGNVIKFRERSYEASEDEPTERWKGSFQGVPRLYGECSFETYQGNDLLVSDLRGTKYRGIVLRGPTGCGKTHLAIAMVRDDVKSRFVTVPDLLLKIRASFNGGDESEEVIIRKYSEIPVLVMDDLGAEKTTEFSVTTLYIILDRRIRDCLRTIITTNLSQSQVEDAFGGRIASRLAGMENIKINMPDHRKKK
jgi:DNA replication protein DnaC